MGSTRAGRLGRMASLKNHELDLKGVGFSYGHPSKGDTTNAEHEVQELVADSAADSFKGSSGGSLLRDMLDISPIMQDFAAAVVDDSFLRCFQSQPPEPWNWNVFMLPTHYLSIVVRYGILFPLRFVAVVLSWLIFLALFFSVPYACRAGPARMRVQRALLQAQMQLLLATWSARIRYHGPRPVPAANRVWVANHTSIVDYAILSAATPFACIMQLQPGFLGFLQTQVLPCVGGLFFNRTEVSDRKLVHKRMVAHVQDPEATPLLVFPEGTCVNNEYCVMFKRGAFDLGATVCPIAIKYNKFFVDAFWNSKRYTLQQHITQLMTSWALVGDVWFLEPQQRREGESSIEFAARVQRMIAARAKLEIMPWDGYLKYYNLEKKHPELAEKQRKAYAQRLLADFPGGRAALSDAAKSSGDVHTPASIGLRKR